MNQNEFNRRAFMTIVGASAAAGAFGIPGLARAQEALKFWAPGIAKVGAQDWSDILQEPEPVAYLAGRSDRHIAFR